MGVSVSYWWHKILLGVSYMDERDTEAQLHVMEAFLDGVQKGEAVSLATVIKSQGSESPPVGAKMAVWGDGRTAGSFGAPALEAEIAKDCLQAISQGVSQAFIYPKTASRTLRARRTAPLEVFVEVVQSPTLIVVGGGHIGYFVARLGKMVGFQVMVLDDRPEFASEERFPEADVVIAADFEETLKNSSIGENTYIVIVTRGHKQDEVSLRQVVESPAAYIGMIGSRRRVGAVLKHIHESGVPLESLARVRSPIGLDIGAETPEEIAITIIAEIIMVRRGGTGLPLSEKERIVVE